MVQPSTELARNFLAQLNALADSLKQSEVVVTQDGKQDKVSHAIEIFFQAIQQLPSSVATLDIRPTVLFEIDCALLGVYGNNLLANADLNSPIRKLMRDLAALWQRYYLIVGLEKLDGLNKSPLGVSNFYEAWIKEGTDTEHAEYDILLKDVVLLLHSSSELNLSAKVTLFSLMGKISATLGVSDDFAQDRLHNHLDNIQARAEETSDEVLAEILLCLQVLSSRGKGITDTGIDVSTIQKAIRYWSSRDEFLRKLFTAWAWLLEYDFTSALKMGDQLHIRDRSALFSASSNASAGLGIGHSFLELMEFKKQNPLFTSVYQPIPIFMFGTSGVGKSSYLTSFCYNVTMRSGRALAMGTKLTVFYENQNEAWRSGSMIPTNELTMYDFWEDLNIAGYCTYDYGGRDVNPDQWDQQFLNVFRNARGLLFFIDENDYMDPARLKRRAGIFDAILSLWVNSNPQVRHMPIGIVLTKCDLVLGDQIKKIQRTTLVPQGFQPGLIEVLVPHRFKDGNPDMQTPLGRLKTMILCDTQNNIAPALQDIVQTIMDNFSQFLSRILNVTYHYQIFLTSSLPPGDLQDTLYPWGVKEPLTWMIRVLERFHLQESILKFNADEKKIEDQLRIVKDDIAKAHELRDQITHWENERKTLMTKSKWYQPNVEQKNKFFEELTKKGEQDLKGIVKRYTKEQNEMDNSIAWIQSIERDEQEKQGLLDALRAKRNDFTSRLKAEVRW